MGWDHRSLEGALYGLGSRPEGRPATPRPLGIPAARPSIVRPMPRGLMRRLEVDLVLRRSLSEEERRVIYEHYVLSPRRQHPYRERKRIIGTLLAMLNDEALDEQPS